MEGISLWHILLTLVIGIPQGLSAKSSPDTLAVIGFTPGRPLRDDGWKEKIYNRPVSWEVVQGPDGPVLHGTSNGCASMPYKVIRCGAHEHPILRWQWKVMRLPRKGKENDRSNDDYGARVYVFFPGWTFLTSHVLEYVWDNETPAGTVKASPSSGRCKLIVVNSGTGDLGKWIAVERDLCDDYTRAFGRAPDRPAGGIGFMSDSDNTSSEAEAYYGEVRMLRNPKPHPAIKAGCPAAWWGKPQIPNKFQAPMLQLFGHWNLVFMVLFHSVWVELISPPPLAGGEQV